MNALCIVYLMLALLLDVALDHLARGAFFRHVHMIAHPPPTRLCPPPRYAAKPASPADVGSPCIPRTESPGDYSSPTPPLFSKAKLLVGKALQHQVPGELGALVDARLGGVIPSCATYISTPAILGRTRLRMGLWANSTRFTLARNPQ